MVKLFKKILVKDVMVKQPFTIGLDEPFSRVWDIFKLHKIRHLPVLDNNRILKGLITQRDLYRIISPRKTLEGNLIYDKSELDNYILEYVMTKKVVTLSPQDVLGKAIDIMVNSKYGCLPIINTASFLEGIVTKIDVLKAVGKFVI